jgi:hypothetical protein
MYFVSGVYILSRVRWYARREWWVLAQMIGFISTSVTQCLLMILKYRQYSAIADLHNLRFTSVLIYIQSSQFTLSSHPSALNCWTLLDSPLLVPIRFSSLRLTDYTAFTSLISLRHGPHRKQPLSCCRGVFTSSLHSNRRGADGIENGVLLLLHACMLRTLSSNDRCLQIHCLAMGLYGTLLPP